MRIVSGRREERRKGYKNWTRKFCVTKISAVRSITLWPWLQDVTYIVVDIDCYRHQPVLVRSVITSHASLSSGWHCSHFLSFVFLPLTHTHTHPPHALILPSSFPPKYLLASMVETVATRRELSKVHDSAVGVEFQLMAWNTNSSMFLDCLCWYSAWLQVNYSPCSQSSYIVVYCDIKQINHNNYV